MDTTHLPPPNGAERSPVSAVLGLPVEVAATALGLQLLAGTTNVLQLQPLWIARQLFPAEDPVSAADRVELHVLQLEEAGMLSTWAEGDCEWLTLTRPSDAVPGPPILPARPRPASGPAPGPSFVEETQLPPLPPFSSAGKRERAREEAHARARARADAEERAHQDRWRRWEEEYTAQAPVRPRRPAILDAPPIGCPNHPYGTVSEECGPCGTAADRRRDHLARAKYTEQLSIFEERQPTDEGMPDDDEPF